MNRKFQTLTAAAVLACAGALGAAAAMAQEHPTGPTCGDILWHADLLRDFPRAPAACQEVVVTDGKKVEYSKLQKDDVLTFWVPERQLGVISDPHDTAASTIILN